MLRSGLQISMSHNVHARCERDRVITARDGALFRTLIHVGINPARWTTAESCGAEAHQVRIIAILETHIYADFAFGARELAVATLAPICVSRAKGRCSPRTTSAASRSSPRSRSAFSSPAPTRSTSSGLLSPQGDIGWLLGAE